MERNTKHKLEFLPRLCAVFCLVLMLVLSGCGGSGGRGGSRGSTTDFPVPTASGDVTYGSGGVSIDASNTSDGYFMVKYSGSASKIKIQVTGTDNAVYMYTSHKGDLSLIHI